MKKNKANQDVGDIEKGANIRDSREENEGKIGRLVWGWVCPQETERDTVEGGGPAPVRQAAWQLRFMHIITMVTYSRCFDVD